MTNGLHPLGCHYTWKDDPHSSHSIALAWIRRLPVETRILDIGCADGTFGARLQRPKELLTGVEPTPGWARQAEAYYGAVLNVPLQEVGEDVIGDHGVVLLLDVLEHMPDPYRELARLSKALSSQGHVIISVPNVAHAYVRIKLLLGHFEYTDRGILDRSHLRFFEINTLRRVVHDAGLAIEKLTATPVPLPLVHRFFKDTGLGRSCHCLSANIARAWPSLFGYQFIILARPRRPQCRVEK